MWSLRLQIQQPGYFIQTVSCPHQTLNSGQGAKKVSTILHAGSMDLVTVPFIRASQTMRTRELSSGQIKKIFRFQIKWLSWLPFASWPFSLFSLVINKTQTHNLTKIIRCRITWLYKMSSIRFDNAVATLKLSWDRIQFFTDPHSYFCISAYFVLIFMILKLKSM